MADFVKSLREIEDTDIGLETTLHVRCSVMDEFDELGLA